MFVNFYIDFCNRNNKCIISQDVFYAIKIIYNIKIEKSLSYKLLLYNQRRTFNIFIIFYKSSNFEF